MGQKDLTPVWTQGKRKLVSWLCLSLCGTECSPEQEGQAQEKRKLNSTGVSLPEFEVNMQGAGRGAWFIYLAWEQWQVSMYPHPVRLRALSAAAFLASWNSSVGAHTCVCAHMYTHAHTQMPCLS
jgi:hypothetical protein